MQEKSTYFKLMKKHKNQKLWNICLFLFFLNLVQDFPLLYLLKDMKSSQVASYLRTAEEKTGMVNLFRNKLLESLFALKHEHQQSSAALP